MAKNKTPWLNTSRKLTSTQSTSSMPPTVILQIPREKMEAMAHLQWKEAWPRSNSNRLISPHLTSWPRRRKLRSSPFRMQSLERSLTRWHKISNCSEHSHLQLEMTTVTVPINTKVNRAFLLLQAKMGIVTKSKPCLTCAEKTSTW